MTHIFSQFRDNASIQWANTPDLGSFNAFNAPVIEYIISFLAPPSDPLSRVNNLDLQNVSLISSGFRNIVFDSLQREVRNLKNGMKTVVQALKPTPDKAHKAYKKAHKAYKAHIACVRIILGRAVHNQKDYQLLLIDTILVLLNFSQKGRIQAAKQGNAISPVLYKTDEDLQMNLDQLFDLILSKKGVKYFCESLKEFRKLLPRSQGKFIYSLYTHENETRLAISLARCGAYKGAFLLEQIIKEKFLEYTTPENLTMAIKIARTVQDSTSRECIYESIMTELLNANNIKKALKLVNNFDSPEGRDEQLYHIANSLLDRGNLNKATKIAKTITNDSSRREVLQLIAEKHLRSADIMAVRPVNGTKKEGG